MTYRKTVTLPVTPDEAFALVTEPDRLRRWKTVSAYVDLRAGGEYRFTIVPGQVACGTYREIEPGRRLVFGWGWQGSEDLPPDTSTVTVTVEPIEGGSRVTLTHDGLTPEQTVTHAEGWHHYFERLEQLATTGDTGQDEWHWAPPVLDQTVAADAVLSAIQPVLRGLADADPAAPTPCRGLALGDLVDHLVESLASLGAMAGVKVTTAGRDIEDRVSSTAAQTIAAWRARGVADALAANVLPVEILLHGWDLAQASGQTVRVSDEVVEYVHSLAELLVPGGRKRGSFGPEVEPAPGADALGRLAAYAGRRALA